MTTPDKDLAARLAFIAASHDELQIGKTVEKAAAEMELRYHLHAAYRTNQLITTAEADARVKAAVLAGNAMVKQLDTMMLMLSGETAMTKSSLERALSGALDARNMWTDTIRARGEPL